jgi:hypothetical protein
MMNCKGMGAASKGGKGYKAGGMAMKPAAKKDGLPMMKGKGYKKGGMSKKDAC